MQEAEPGRRARRRATPWRATDGSREGGRAERRQDAGDAGEAARGAGRRRGRSRHRQRRDRQRPPLQDRRVAALRAVRVRARLRHRRADAGPRAHPRRRHQERRALPAARAGARLQGARSSRPPTARWSTSRSRPRRRRRCWPCSITTIRSAARRCRATAPPSTPTCAGKVAYETGDTAHAEALFSERRPPVALLRRRALLPRPHPGAARATSPRRAATCARLSSRPTRTASPSSSTAATSRSRTWPTWRSVGSPTSRGSTTTRTTSTSGCPSDSDRLPDALFEASWSMFQKGEYEAARAFLEEFDHNFPGSPLAPDVMLLHAMIDLKSCQFDTVRATLDKFVQVYGPIEVQVAALLKDPGKRGGALPAPAQQGVDRHAARSDCRSAEGRPALLQVLRRHPRRSIGRPGVIPNEVAIWDELSAHQKGQTEGVDATEAVRLVQDVESLRPLAAGDPEMEERVSQLADEAHRAARLQNVTSGPFAKEAAADAGAGRRGAEAARAPGRRDGRSSPARRWRIWTSDCAISCGRRASPRSTPSSARRRSWRSRSSTCATAATRLSCSPRSSSRD